MNARNLHDQADGALKEQAVEELTWRILQGKHKNGIYELLDIELNEPKTAKLLLTAITDLLLDDSASREALIDRIRDGLIERYLKAHPELVEEEADEIEADA